MTVLCYAMTGISAKEGRVTSTQDPRGGGR